MTARNDNVPHRGGEFGMVPQRVRQTSVIRTAIPSAESA